MSLINIAERAIVPDSIIRLGIRQLLKQRLRKEYAQHDPERQQQQYTQLLSSLFNSPIALNTAAANAQHYEVPTEFFQLCLGTQLKYSSGYWPHGVNDLDAAEAAMLQQSCEHAALVDGQRILELGCGWGSLTLWIAQQYPNSRITAVSNSNTQREYIQQQAQQRGLTNVKVITADMNDFSIDATFDRVVSVEMFEHMRNYAELMQRIARWLSPNGQLFVHIFCHRTLMYPFTTEGEDDWMGRYFFTGGIMPAADTLLHFQTDLTIAERWLFNGCHYQKTLEAWLDKTDNNADRITALFQTSYGKEQAQLWLQRWRMFFMACAELFGYNHGTEWLVAHYRFNKSGK